MSIEYETQRDCQAGPPGAVRVYRTGERAFFPPSYQPPHHFKRVGAPEPSPVVQKEINRDQVVPMNDAMTAVDDAIQKGEVIRAGAGAGRPTVKALEKRLGVELDSKDRDEAYEAWQAVKNR